MNKKAIGLYAATSLVIANMVGTGVFTSLGFQVIDIHSVFAVLCLWIIGGLLALCGAFAYGELGAAMPRSGGEYRYLSDIYHPFVGFLSGWVSILVGFSAPIALAAMALGKYFTKAAPALDPTMIAIGVVAVITLIHATSIQVGVGFQNVFTTIKVILILFFIVAGFMASQHEAITILPQAGSWRDIFSPAFAVSLIYVSYAYSGWNASAYIAGEMENPQRNLPRSLFTGTLIVTGLYVLLNFIFLYTVPMHALAGQVEVGFLSANGIFGALGGKVMAMVISLLLVSTISSMILAGPRVTQAMGEDLKILGFLSRKTKNGVPAIAIILQSVVTVILILTGSFERVLTYVGFTLNLFTFLTVLGLFIFRIKNPNAVRPYKTWGYPFTPALFLLLNLWIMYNLIVNKPVESSYGFLTLLLGAIVYLLGANKKTIKTN